MKLVNKVLSLLLLWTLAAETQIVLVGALYIFSFSCSKGDFRGGQTPALQVARAETQPNGDRRRAQIAQQSCGGGEDEGGRSSIRMQQFSG